MTHWPWSHTRPAPQSASFAQVEGHASAAPSHVKGAHPGSPALPAASGPQVPSVAAPVATAHAAQAPSQRALQHTPSVQKPEAHSASFAHFAPAPRVAGHAAEAPSHVNGAQEGPR